MLNYVTFYYCDVDKGIVSLVLLSVLQQPELSINEMISLILTFFKCLSGLGTIWSILDAF